MSSIVFLWREEGPRTAYTSVSITDGFESLSHDDKNMKFMYQLCLGLRYLQECEVNFVYMSIGNCLGNFQTIASGFIFLLFIF